MSLMSRWKSLSRSTRAAIGTMALLLLLEGFFDIFEIAIGKVMSWTNDKRPKVGRLWTEEERDLSGQQLASTRIDSLRQLPAHQRHIRTLDDLAAYLAFKSDLSLTRDDFLMLYRNLPGEDAGRLIDPIILRDLALSGSWNSVKMSHGEDRLTLLFLDPYGQPVLDSHILLAPKADTVQVSHLAENPLFAGRTLPAMIFASAYNSLPRRLQLQIINDPQKWKAWSVSLITAAISPRVSQGAVTVALEVAEAETTAIHEVQASEMAAGYLIDAINKMSPNSSFQQAAKENDNE